MVRLLKEKKWMPKERGFSGLLSEEDDDHFNATTTSTAAVDDDDDDNNNENKNDEVKLLLNFNIQTDWGIRHGRPDIVIANNKTRETIIVIDNVVNKEIEECWKYQDLVREIGRQWKSKVKVVLVVVGVLGSISQKLKGY